jgi:hypothetical protein
LFVRLLPVLLITVASVAYVAYVEGPDGYAVRNTAPMACVILLSFGALWLGNGAWLGNGWRWPLGIIGYAIPALGLSLYLHYAYAVNLNEMFSGSENAMELFRYLPAYTAISGSIGFAIGWIIGSRV